MKLTLASLTALLAVCSPALAWPVSHSSPNATVRSASMAARLVQLDNDPEWEVYTGGPEFLHLAASGAYSLAEALPQPATVPDAILTDTLLGRGDAGDIDGDGDTDIVYSLEVAWDPFATIIEPEDTSGASELMRVVVCQNNGVGVFTRTWQIHEGAVRSLGAPDIRLADIDRDGDLDMVETHGTVKIRWNDGSGAFANGFPTGEPLVLGPATVHSSTVQVDDFDRNGWPDVLMIDPQGAITLASQDASGFTTTQVHAAVETGTRYWWASLLADLNGDNLQDLLIRAGGGAHSIRLLWLRNTGAGFAAPVEVAEYFDTHAELRRFHAGDLDEDGVVDIVFDRQKLELRWRRGLGGGAFASEAILASLSTSQHSRSYGFMGVADMNRDGTTDVFWDQGDWKNAARLRQPHATVTPWSGTALTGTTDLTTGDINTDGRPDLIALDGGAKFIRWYASGAAGLSTGIPMSISGSTAPLQVAAGDWNRDGWTDLAWCGDSLLRQAISTAGSGIGWNQSTAASLTDISAILAYDMDVDGDTDILSASSGGVFRTWRNNGSGSAWAAHSFLVGSTDGSRIAAGQGVRGGRAEAAALSLASGTTPGRLRVFNYDSPITPLHQVNGLATPASAALHYAELFPNTPGDELIYANSSNDVQATGAAEPIATMSEPVVQIATADWDGNGSNDVLVTTTRRITLLYREADTGLHRNIWQTTELHSLAAPQSFRDLVVLDMNDDGLPDAAATDSSGEIHLLTNTSAPVRVTVSATAGSTGSGLVPGSSGPAITVAARLADYHRHFGRGRIAPVTLKMRFRRSTPSGGTDTPGTSLTAAEALALVDSVWLQKGTTASAPVAPALAADGTFTLNLSPTLRVPFASDTALTTTQLHVKLKSTAAAAAVQRFYVEVAPADPTWVALDNDDLSGPRLLRQFTEQTANALALIYVRTPGPLDNWRLANFSTYDGTGPASNDADPDGDGMANLFEYVMGQNPNIRGGVGFTPVVGVSFDAGQDAMVADLRLLTTYDSKVRLTLQYSHNPAAGWNLLSTRTGTGPWTGITPYTTTTLSGGRTRFGFDGGFNPAIFKKTFFRLKAEELP